MSGLSLVGFSPPETFPLLESPREGKNRVRLRDPWVLQDYNSQQPLRPGRKGPRLRDPGGRSRTTTPSSLWGGAEAACPQGPLQDYNSQQALRPGRTGAEAGQGTPR